MADRATDTRARILEAAETLVLARGFAGTSLDDILKTTGLTKGAFFHHFASKAELARALVERYASNDYALFSGFAAEADRRSDDPLDRAMIFLALFEDWVEALGRPPPGCVFASYTYESQQFDPAIHEFIADNLGRWQALYEEKFARLIERYAPRRPVTARGLAEMIVALIEGGFIVSLSRVDATFIARQSRQFRDYLGLLFDERRPARAAGKRKRPRPAA